MFVRSGDTLASISRKFYKSPKRWEEILDANKSIRNPEFEGRPDLDYPVVLLLSKASRDFISIDKAGESSRGSVRPLSSPWHEHLRLTS